MRRIFVSCMRLPLVSLTLTLIAAFTVIPTAFSQGTPVQFTSPVLVPNASSFPAPGAYKAVAGYFNSDKRLDIAFSGLSTEQPTQVSFGNIALNQGNGTFNVISSTAGFITDGGVGPDLAADLNGDGISDVVSWSYGPAAGELGGLKIQFGMGDGTFSDGTFIKVDAANSAVVDAVAADFDGNGSMDLAVLTDANKLVIFLNDGHGNLHSAFTISVPQGAQIAAGDINGDTLSDVVLVSDKTVTPYLSTHGGDLVKGNTFSLPTGGGAPVIVDFNHDGYADVAVPTGTGIKFLLGSPGGELTSGPTASNIAPYIAIAFADFNKDGKLDIATTGTLSGASYVNVYFGNGNGTFNSPSVYGTGNLPVSLIAGDIYGAGNIDLVTFGAGISGLTVLHNLGNGYFDAALVSHSANATGIVAGDFNRDGKQDVAVVNTPICKAPCSGTVSVFPGSGSTWFNAGKTYRIGMHGSAIAAGDLNKDGILDLVVVNAVPGDSADTSVLLGKSDGTFQTAHNYKLGSLSNDAVLADVNKDGKLDLITDGGVALGRGDGTFSAIKAFPGGFNFAEGTRIAVGDVNGDGKLDVVAVLSGCADAPAFMQVLLGDGKGGFTAGDYSYDLIAQTITSVALGRLRPAGPLDVVYSYSGGCGLQVGGQNSSGAAGLTGDGHGGFPTSFGVTSGPLYGDPGESGPVVLADFNGDGKLDVGIGAGGYFVVARGNGNDTFQPPQLFTADLDSVDLANPGSNFPTVIPGGIAIADFNRDGQPDVALASGLGVARLYNKTHSK